MSLNPVGEKNKPKFLNIEPMDLQEEEYYAEEKRELKRRLEEPTAADPPSDWIDAADAHEVAASRRGPGRRPAREGGLSEGSSFVVFFFGGVGSWQHDYSGGHI